MALEAAKSKVKVPADLVSDEGHFPVHTWLSSLCNLTWQKRQGNSLGSHKGKNPTHEECTLIT